MCIAEYNNIVVHLLPICCYCVVILVLTFNNGYVLIFNKTNFFFNKLEILLTITDCNCNSEDFIKIIIFILGERSEAEAYFLQKVQSAQATQSYSVQEEQGKACLSG